MTDRENLLKARSLIQARRYSEARAVLREIDHPTAWEWLAKLDRYPLDSQEQPAAPVSADGDSDDAEDAASRRRHPVLVALLLFIGGLLGLALAAGVLAWLGDYLSLDLFFRSDAAMRLRVPTAILTGMLTGMVVGAVIRLIGRAGGVGTALWTMLLTLLALVGGHFGALILGSLRAGLVESPLDPAVIDLYAAYLGSVPGDSLIIYSAIILFALGMGWIIGAWGDEPHTA
jgi:hypothetical protein